MNSQGKSKSTRYAAMVIIALTLFALTESSGQDRCGTVEYTNKLKSQRSLIESTEQFEEWLRGKIKSTVKQNENKREQTAPYQIPVVVHIIHNGEAEGLGTNITDAQILSQINVLNNDYKRLNADASDTPAEFAAVAGMLDIEFVLAKQDPEGLATTGIVRVQGSKTEWTINDNYELKSLSYWPAEDYLNLWVCNITDYLGYAQFPVSGLPGLENSSDNRLTDGVVIYYRTFGSEDDGAFDLDSKYNKGRTATHEIGHFFGLRHIWGDDSGACGGNGDYVVDTPDQANNSINCPSHPRTTCTVHSMFQNYMDYTDDRCMNLFTADQVGRMTTIIENSVRRVTLPTSHGLLDPIPIANDAGIKSILSPQISECSNTITPSLEVRNYGSNTITSARIRFSLNSTAIETKDVVVNIAPLGFAVINFAPLFVSAGTSTFTFEILLTNGGADGNSFNNVKTVDVFIPEILTTPFMEPFDVLPASWTVVNPDDLTTWELTVAEKDSPSNTAMGINFYDYEDSEGEIDLLISPNVNLSTVSIAVLNFDIAYARYQSSNDGLKVYVLTDCNPNIYDGTLIYSKSGSALATTASTNDPFTPSGADEWRVESVSLQPFIGQQNIQLAFVGFNDWGNNLYLDNIAILTEELEDVSVGDVTPAFITCQENVQLHTIIENVGTVTITDFDIEVTVDGNIQTTSFTGLGIQPGQSMEVTTEAVSLLSGNNEVHLELVNPNGVDDYNPSNNSKEVSLTLNTSSSATPFSESFEGFFNDDWIIINPTGGMEWETTTTPGFGTSLYFNAYDNEELGEKAWLVSPVLNLSDASEASLTFYTSYAQRSTKQEKLQVFYSLDCGNSFEPDPVFEASGQTLSSVASADEWEPASTQDWKQHSADLTPLIGNNALRFAFVVTNSNGNNLYLDDINFSSLEYDIYRVYDKRDNYDFYITFNLPESQTVYYEVIDVMGRRLVEGEVVDVLDQTFPISLAEGTASGVYIIRLGIGSEFYATKIYVSR